MTQKRMPVAHIPIRKTLNTVVIISCPHCGYGRKVEPDANYTVECFSCGKKYAVSSPI